MNRIGANMNRIVHVNRIVPVHTAIALKLGMKSWWKPANHMKDWSSFFVVGCGALRTLCMFSSSGSMIPLPM